MKAKELQRFWAIIPIVWIALLVALLIAGGKRAGLNQRNNALYAAVERSDLAMVKELLQEHADPNVRAPTHISWMFWQAHTNDFRPSALRCVLNRIITLSFQAGKQPDAADPDTAIAIALLEAGADAAPKDGGRNLLEDLLPLGNHTPQTIAEALLKHGAPLPATLVGQPLVAGAISCRQPPQMIDNLLRAGADVKGAAGRAAMIVAYRQWDLSESDQKEKLAIMRSLLIAGADPNTPLPPATTLLGDAVTFQKTPVIQLLTEFHADPNIVMIRGLPLLYSVMDCRSEVMEMLLRAGADANTHQANGEPILWYAVIHSIEESSEEKRYKVERLLNHGADVHARFNTTVYGSVTVQEAAHRGAKDYHIDPKILAELDWAAKRGTPLKTKHR